MKSILTTIIALVFTFSFANAQTTGSSSKMKSSGTSMNSTNKDYVTMKNGKMSEYKNGTWTPLTTTFTCTDGCKVSTDGTYTMANGTTKKLSDGDKVSKSGKMWSKSSSSKPKSSATPK